MAGKIGALKQAISAGRAAFLEKNAALQQQAAIIEQLKAQDLAAHLKTGLPESTYVPSDALQKQIQGLQLPKFKSGGKVSDKENFRLSDSGNVSALQQVKDIFNPEIMKRAKPMSQEDAMNVAMGAMTTTPNKPLLTLFHGGRKFDKWNPQMIGMGEGRGLSRPTLALGPGLYAGNKPELAKIYLKYGGENPVLSKMQVNGSNIINYSQKEADELLSHQEQLERIKEAESRLDKLGLNTVKYGLTNAWLGGRETKSQYDAIREALIKSKIDGLKYNLDAKLLPGEEAWMGHEYSIFNPDIIKSIEHVDPSKFKNGGQVTQPSKMNNTFMCGGLNLINPKNKSKGPLNIQWNSNNLIAAGRKNSVQ
jgi:hypothetical protein